MKCTKCGQDFKHALLTAMLQDAGARVHPKCKHDFVETGDNTKCSKCGTPSTGASDDFDEYGRCLTCATKGANNEPG